MKFRAQILPVLAVLTILLPCSLTAALQPIPAEKWSISTGGENSPAANYCAEELQKLLACRIGKKLPVSKDKKTPSGPVILLDKTDPALGTEAFRIVREKDVIRIIGGTPIGTLYGVYEFLQRYCDVWNVAPGVIYAPKGSPLSSSPSDLQISLLMRTFFSGIKTFLMPSL